jgi:hypothetical protein
MSLGLRHVQYFILFKTENNLLFGPAFAMLKYIGPSCFNLKFSSANFSP